MSEEVQDDSYIVLESERNLVIQHREFGKEGKASPWEAKKLDQSYLLVSRSKASLDENQGVGFCPAYFFKDVVKGLSRNNWSGVLKVDAGGFLKQIYFNNGRFCFASSQLIDDRLGERMYRTNRITLDQLVESASQVDRNTKFGQVLINSKIMNAVELWDALKDQVLEIFRSVFMHEKVRYSLDQGKNKAFMEVVFKESTVDLIDDAFSYAHMLRNFGQNLKTESKIAVSTVIANDPKYQPGTFVGDMIELVNTTANIGEFISQSKLRPHNTLAVLLHLVSEGTCRIEDGSDVAVNIGDLSSSLKSKLDVYAFLLKNVNEAFRAQGTELPVQEMKSFALGLNPEGDPCFALDETGAISSHGLRNMYFQCNENVHRVRLFEKKVEALIQFTLQLVIDLCPFEVSKGIRNKYREMVS